jgi:hypothetical protein
MTPNPGGVNGRNREIQERIRRAVREGADLVEFFFELKRGYVTETDKNGKRTQRRLTAKELKYRIRAAEWLADRGFGRAPLVVESTHEDHQFRTLTLRASQAELDELERLLDHEQALLDRISRQAIETTAREGGQ